VDQQERPIRAVIRDRRPPDAPQALLGVPLPLWTARALLLAGLDATEIAIASTRPLRWCPPGLRTEAPDAPFEGAADLDAAHPFFAPETLRRALGTGETPQPATPIERLRIESQSDLELADAVARGLPPNHPSLSGIAPMRLRLAAAERPLRAVITDVDGVLTDGRVSLTMQGDEARAFHHHDGLGTKRLIKAGVLIGWLSAAKDTGLVRRRAEHLGVHAIDVGSGGKGKRFRNMCEWLGVEPQDVAYIGDDANDLPAMQQARLSACPADAQQAVRRAADIRLEAVGGAGAFREFANLLLAALEESAMRLTSQSDGEEE